MAILLALGVWQVRRLAWKTALLAQIAALQTAPPEPLGVVLNRLGRAGQPAQGEVDFVRVQTTCPTLQQTPTLHLYALLDGVLGDRLITACPLQDGRYRSLLVDRGFVDRDHLGEVRPGPAARRPHRGRAAAAGARHLAQPAQHAGQERLAHPRRARHGRQP